MPLSTYSMQYFVTLLISFMNSDYGIEHYQCIRQHKYFNCVARAAEITQTVFKGSYLKFIFTVEHKHCNRNKTPEE